MIRKFVLAAILAAAPLGAVQAMSVAQFLEKADRLEKKGMAAMFCSDFKLLKREVQTATQQLRAERLAAVRTGRRGAYCPGPKASLHSRELLAHFRAIPPAQRGVDIKDALRVLLARKYPCRTG